MQAGFKAGAKPGTVDEYLATLARAKRAALERLRKIVHAAAPGVEECISYGLPAFRLGGKCLVWIGAAANHCAIYGVAGTRNGELKDYDTSGRGTLRFRADAPLPAALVRKLVKARIARVAARRPMPPSTRSSAMTFLPSRPQAQRQTCASNDRLLRDGRPVEMIDASLLAQAILR